jgi:hypothetical protein
VSQCRRWESNPHSRGNTILSRAYMLNFILDHRHISANTMYGKNSQIMAILYHCPSDRSLDLWLKRIKKPVHTTEWRGFICKD